VNNRYLEPVARVVISASLVVAGYEHALLWSSGYRDVPVIGLAFIVQASASFALALLILLGGPWTLRLAAAGLSAGALGAFVLSRTVGIFGFVERGWDPAPHAAISVAAEVVTLLACLGTLADVRACLVTAPVGRTIRT
jgi:hypothetical protein